MQVVKFGQNWHVQVKIQTAMIILPRALANYDLVGDVLFLLKVYKKYQNNSRHIQIVVSVGRSQKPRKSKMSPAERGKRYILAFPATRKAKSLQTLEFDLLENQLKSGLRTVRVLTGCSIWFYTRGIFSECINILCS